MIAVKNFTSELVWYNGSGCVVCGSNYSDLGAEFGVQGVDLNVSLDGTGESLGLCFTHAREAGHLVGMVPADALAAIEEAASLTYEASAAMKEEALAAQEQAAADRAAVLRLLADAYADKPVAKTASKAAK